MDVGICNTPAAYSMFSVLHRRVEPAVDSGPFQPSVRTKPRALAQPVVKLWLTAKNVAESIVWPCGTYLFYHRPRGTQLHRIRHMLSRGLPHPHGQRRGVPRANQDIGFAFVARAHGLYKTQYILSQQLTRARYIQAKFLKVVVVIFKSA
jgi:hypothetical protein